MNRIVLIVVSLTIVLALQSQATNSSFDPIIACINLAQSIERTCLDVSDDFYEWCMEDLEEDPSIISGPLTCESDYSDDIEACARTTRRLLKGCIPTPTPTPDRYWIPSNTI